MADEHPSTQPSFESAGDVGLLGMWVFLATEVLFFGALFMAYTFVRWESPATVAAASGHLELLLGGINTVVLLTSSFILTLGLFFHGLGRTRLAMWLIIATAMLGVLFLCIKATEYLHVAHEGLLPGRHFRYERIAPSASPMPGGMTGALGMRGAPMPSAVPGVAELFFWLYFVMTGLHGLHLLVGIGLLGVVAALLWRNPAGVSPGTVHNVGLYWHFVDVIWIFLFPLLYLAGHWKF